MKQHITKEQWDELEPDQITKFVDSMVMANPELSSVPYPSIGQMIEFLGDDLKKMHYPEIKCFEWGSDKELADELWEDCKIKAKK